MAMNDVGIVYESDTSKLSYSTTLLSFSTTLRKALKGANCIELCTDHGRIPLQNVSCGVNSGIGVFVFYMEDKNGNYLDACCIVDLDQPIDVAMADGFSTVNFMSMVVTNSQVAPDGTSFAVDCNEKVVFTNKTIVPLCARDLE